MKVALRIWVCLMFFLGTTVAQQALGPREQLNQYVAQLQAHPDDRGLREKIIKLAQELKPPPVVPREAKEHEGAAEYAFKSAGSQSDFAKAAAEYEQALLLAPWVASDYFNLGVAREKAGDLDKAVAAFELYLLAAPNAADADDVVKRIGALKFEAKNASDAQAAAERERQAELARQRQADAAAEAERQRDADFLRRFDGAHYRFQARYNTGTVQFDYEIHGSEVVELMTDDDRNNRLGRVQQTRRYRREGDTFLQEEGSPEVCQRRLGTSNCRLFCTIKENEISCEDMVDGQPLGTHRLSIAFGVYAAPRVR